MLVARMHHLVDEQLRHDVAADWCLLSRTARLRRARRHLDGRLGDVTHMWPLNDPWSLNVSVHGSAQIEVAHIVPVHHLTNRSVVRVRRWPINASMGACHLILELR